jgi:glyoxylase-like metal-dependent hydrolase (beta-lactamase superfamily II)
MVVRQPHREERAMTGPLRVHHLNCAHLTALRLGGVALACHVLLVETPRDGLVLVDTGLGTADYAAIPSRLGWAFAHGYARPTIDPSLAAIHQIRGLGHEPRDVRHIVQTHLDLDHVGGLSDFPWARVHVHTVELHAAVGRHGLLAHARYRPAMWAHGPRWETYAAEGESWFGFRAVRSLRGLPTEIFFVRLPGHTLGHCGVAVDTDSGWLLHAGDAYFDPREVHQTRRKCAAGVGLFQWVVATDQRLRRRSQDQLRRLVADHPEITVFSAHDPGAAPAGAVPRPRTTRPGRSGAAHVPEAS